jgi:sortase A
MARAARTLGTLLVVAGAGLLVWTLVVWRWQDPFTGLYTRYEQHRLAHSLDVEFERYAATERATEREAVAAEERRIAIAATRFRRDALRGQAIGRIIVPRLGLNMVLVNGTDDETLKKGPGRDPRTFMPGQGQLVYIAGHRTTYLAPFSHIDVLRKGDRVTLEMPYATFIYRVTGHRIVPANDLAVLRSSGREQLELQACHPRFFATHRYIAFARPVRVIPRTGRPYAPVTPAARATA